MRAALPGVAVAALVAGMAAVTGWAVLTLGFVHGSTTPRYLAAQGACWLLFAGALVLLRRVPKRVVPALVLAGAAVLGGCALLGPPDTSTDSARYAWDGIVLDHGISPYRYVPADARLADLRPDWLFPPAGDDCAGPRFRTTPEIGATDSICTALNRPRVHTIYPPAAEYLFAGMRLIVPASAQYWPMQVVGLLADLATTALLLVTLGRLGRDRRWAALWAWCPLVLSEGVTNSHVDVVAALVALAGTVLVFAGRPVRGGVLLGIAAAVKVLPLLTLPAAARRAPIRIAVAVVASIAVLYVPFLLNDGADVLGYLPGYLNEEGYGSGTRSALLSWILPAALTTPVAVAVVLGVAIAVFVRGARSSPWVGQLVVIGTALLVLSPRYGWYCLLLVPFVAMSGRWEWLSIALALTLEQLVSNETTFRCTLLAALAICLVGTGIRARRTRRSRPVETTVNLGVS